MHNHKTHPVIHRTNRIMQRAVQPWLSQLLLRAALAVPFWQSGILKWEGFFQLKDTAVELFSSLFQLHLPGGPYSFPHPEIFAFLAGCGEIIFPVLLILGLGTRFAASGIFLMTCIIEMTIPEGWPIHLTWVAMALALVAWGPGRISLDYLLGDKQHISRSDDD